MLRWWLKPPQIHFLVLIWALVIFILSATPGRELPNIAIEHLDKIAHAIIYGLLAILLVFSFRALGYESLIAVLVIVTTYGLLIEWMQGTFFEGRTFDSLDGIANGIGALIGIVIINRDYAVGDRHEG